MTSVVKTIEDDSVSDETTIDSDTDVGVAVSDVVAGKGTLEELELAVLDRNVGE
jgi:hypothetical protein